MFGAIRHGVFAAAKRGIHDLLFGRDVAARFPRDPADQARQPIALRPVAAATIVYCQPAL